MDSGDKMDFFKVNNKIELITEFYEKIEGLIGDVLEDKIYFSIPADDKNFKLLRVGNKVKGVVYEKHKVLGFYAIVSQRLIRDIPTYELSQFSDFSVVQRRQNVRVPCTLPMMYSSNKYLLNINENNSNNDTQEIKKGIVRYLENGMMRDLSAGGLKFSCTDNLNRNQMLLLVFNIEDDVVIVKGKIVYKEINPTDRKTLYIYGIQFDGLNEEKKEKIINHIFVLMRKKTIKE
ncbi:MAG: flagellar brake protein [Eubacteriales bacterium]